MHQENLTIISDCYILSPSPVIPAVIVQPGNSKLNETQHGIMSELYHFHQDLLSRLLRFGRFRLPRILRGKGNVDSLVYKSRSMVI